MNTVSERATPRKREDRSPSYLAFAKVDGGWIKIGAAWNWRSGENGLSIQLSALPLNFDGRFVLAPPDKEPATGE